MSQQNLTTQKFLEAKNLSVFYGPLEAVKQVNFHVDEGEVVSLIGANGAGKTSILRALSGIQSCKGQLMFNQIDITQMPAHLRIRLGMAQSPEGRGIFPQMSVHENLCLGSDFRKDKNGIAEDLKMCLDLFPRVAERLKQMAGTLSGGEQQMLAICRALMAKPKLLILDEPSLGLAPMIVAQIFEIIRKVHQQGVSVLLVEQNARMALQISHRAYVLETGCVQKCGTGQELLNDDSIRQAYLGASH